VIRFREYGTSSNQLNRCDNIKVNNVEEISNKQKVLVKIKLIHSREFYGVTSQIKLSDKSSKMDLR